MTNKIIDSFRSVVGQWNALATRLGLSAREQARMGPALHLAND
ncbi:hypothetical protein [Burkholderia lata]|nr:hypothetical protein [Burkholderia lata]